MHLARAVRRQDDDGRLGGDDGAKFRDRHLEIRQRFQQESLEGFVRAVHLVDQQHGRAAGLRAHRLQQGALDQIFFGEQLGLQRMTVRPARGFCGADRNHLFGKVPLVDGGRGIKPLIALQADQAAAKGGGQCLGNLGLAGARLAFQKQRAPQPKRQKGHRGQRPAADIVLAGQKLLNGVDGCNGFQGGTPLWQSVASPGRRVKPWRTGMRPRKGGHRRCRRPRKAGPVIRRAPFPRHGRCAGKRSGQPTGHSERRVR